MAACMKHERLHNEHTFAHSSMRSRALLSFGFSKPCCSLNLGKRGIRAVWHEAQQE